jgi:hypothetical protein
MAASVIRNSAGAQDCRGGSIRQREPTRNGAIKAVPLARVRPCGKIQAPLANLLGARIDRNRRKR